MHQSKYVEGGYTNMKKLLLIPCCAFALVGCGASGQEELVQWMAELKATTKPMVKPLSEPKQFNPEDYIARTVIDPFNIQKLTQAILQDSAKNSTTGTTLIDVQRARKKESLEAYPLDTMVMVGSMTKESLPIALLKIDNLIYQVKTGNHIGQNYGQITKITETQVQLLEVVQDATGDWVNRTSSLDLQEGNKK